MAASYPHTLVCIIRCDTRLGHMTLTQSLPTTTDSPEEPPLETATALAAGFLATVNTDPEYAAFGTWELQGHFWSIMTDPPSL